MHQNCKVAAVPPKCACLEPAQHLWLFCANTVLSWWIWRACLEGERNEEADSEVILTEWTARRAAGHT